MEVQRVQSPQTIIMTIGCTLSPVSLEDGSWSKAVFWTLANKNSNVQCYFEVEFNFWNDC